MSTYDLDMWRSVEAGSQRLLAALKREHPRVIDYLIRKNGTADGSVISPE